MFDWLKGIIGSDSPIENPYKLPNHVLDFVARSFAPLKNMDPLAVFATRHLKIDPSIPQKVFRYVVDGSNGDVLKALGAGPMFWGHDPHTGERRAIRWQLYDHWDSLPADVIIRFASVVAASVPGLGRNPRLDIAQKQPWVDALVPDLLGIELSAYRRFAGGAESSALHPLASMARLETLIESAGLPASELVASAFRSGPPPHRWGWSPDYVGRMPGFGASAARNADSVRGTFRAKSFEHRAYLLRLLDHTMPEHLAAFAEELVSLAMDSSRQVREQAVPITKRLGAAAIEIAERAATEQKPEQRALALRLLWEMGSESTRAFVLARGEADSAESVRKAVEQLRSASQAAAPAAPPALALDAVPDLEMPLGTASREALRDILDQINEFVVAAKRKQDELQPRYIQKWEPLSSAALSAIVDQTAEPARRGRPQGYRLQLHANHDRSIKLLKAFVNRKDVRLTHVIRLLESVAGFNTTSPAWSHGPAHVLINEAGRVGRASLLELHLVCDALAIPTESIARDWFGRYGHSVARGWPPDAIWPYFARHPSLIEDGLGAGGRYAAEYWYSRERVFDALATFPQVPVQFVPRLLELALGSSKSDRIGAQRALDRLAGKEDYIIEALASGKADARTAAANWLARLNCVDAVPQIEAALTQEKNDAAAGAQMAALERLGVAVDRFINREKLAADASKRLAKGVPADLAWFPLDRLPTVHWSDSGSRVPEHVVKWLVMQSHKLKSPEPGGVLRRYCAHFRVSDREALGLFVLSAWLKEDVKPIPPAEAERRARAGAASTFAAIQQHPKYFENSPLKGLTEQQIYESTLPSHLRTPAGSAIASKGVLAVAAACGGPEIAPATHRYIKEWYGTRAGQGKALIGMLAWVDHPTATQLMLSIGSRFRTKGFQVEATRHAQLLAERRGWTLDELSDRTIPTAGFDESGETTIDYGGRVFTARLTAEFEVELHNSDGKRIASLPDARGDEDQARVKEAKKQFSAAKKELKSVLALQRERLYEALCTQRRWCFEDWSIYLNRHPIVRRYCEQLVWVSERAGSNPVTFRPLDDGSLTDLADNPVTPAPDDTVILAHDTNTPPDACAAWLQHFQDFKVTPLFQQFGKGSYALPRDMQDATEIVDFRGHVVQAFALRGRASKLGYMRGAAEDGGWFHRYEKRFPALGLEANVEFSGSPLPEQNRPVALLALRFVRKLPDHGGSEPMALGDVPAVLLGESWNDMRLMAADGTGFAADWEKKVQF